MGTGGYLDVVRYTFRSRSVTHEDAPGSTIRGEAGGRYGYPKEEEGEAGASVW